MFRSRDDLVVRVEVVKRGRLNSLPRVIIHHVPTRGNIVGGRWYRLQLLVEAMLKETQRALVDASGLSIFPRRYTPCGSALHFRRA